MRAAFVTRRCRARSALLFMLKERLRRLLMIYVIVTPYAEMPRHIRVTRAAAADAAVAAAFVEPCLHCRHAATPHTLVYAAAATFFAS